MEEEFCRWKRSFAVDGSPKAAYWSWPVKMAIAWIWLVCGSDFVECRVGGGCGGIGVGLWREIGGLVVILVV